VAPPFVPPPFPPLEDINFGNINPEAGLFGAPGKPGGATGVPGGVVFDALNNAVDTGAP
jgi:PAB1-binding protein PBP1